MISYSDWSVLTVSFLVVLYLALSGVALSATLYLVGASWRKEIAPLAASLFALFPLALVLLVILLVGGEHTFPWMNATAEQAEHAHHLPAWHNFTFLAAREVLGMLFVMAVYSVYIKRQAVAEKSEADKARYHNIATWIPFVFVLYATMIGWDFEMTLIPQWHSAIYGMQQFISNLGMFLSFLVIWIYVLNTKRTLVRPINDYMYNYLGQMMLAFTLLWMYTFFAQYLTIWYGNLPSERDRVMGMQDGDYTVLWWSMVFLKFVIPFFSLCINKIRHSPPAILTLATGIIVGTLFERYTWISGVHGTGTMPIVAAIVVGGTVAGIGFVLVRGAMRRDHLIKG
jgi:hypothetical protein